MELIDSHCHLYDTRGVPLDDVIGAARAAGVTTMVNVGCDAATTAAAIDIASRFDGVHATVGLHPHDATDGIDSVTAFLDDPHVVAVGEAGLDYYYEHSPRDVQRQVFAAQIQIAHSRSLPLVIHTRDAWPDTFDVLAAEGVPERTIFHCFTGGLDEAKRCIELGAFVSFSGIVTFSASNGLRDAAAWCPLDRVLVETDSPYLAPVPFRGKTNQPAHVRHTAQVVADVRAIDVEALAAATVENTLRAFPLVAAHRI
ncbi:MAG: TatD family hydrolase [Ilumatobacteraceae bacterium]